MKLTSIELISKSHSVLDLIFGEDDLCERCLKRGKYRNGRVCYQLFAEGTNPSGKKVAYAWAVMLCGYCYPAVSREVERRGEVPLRRTPDNNRVFFPIMDGPCDDRS